MITSWTMTSTAHNHPNAIMPPIIDPVVMLLCVGRIGSRVLRYSHALVRTASSGLPPNRHSERSVEFAGLPSFEAQEQSAITLHALWWRNKRDVRRPRVHIGEQMRSRSDVKCFAVVNSSD